MKKEVMITRPEDCCFGGLRVREGEQNSLWIDRFDIMLQNVTSVWIKSEEKQKLIEVLRNWDNPPASV